ADGTGRRKISNQPVFDAFAFSASPDGRWFLAASPGPNQEHTVQATAFAVDGRTSVPVCLGFCRVFWGGRGRCVCVFERSAGRAPESFATCTFHRCTRATTRCRCCPARDFRSCHQPESHE